MIGQLRSELLKQRTTRAVLWLLLSMAGLLALILLLHVLTLPVADITERDGQLRLLGWGTNIGALFAALLGALSITGENHHGLIRPTFLATPRRTRVILAKAGAAAFAGLLIGLIAEGLAVAMESAGVTARGIPISPTVGDYALLLAGGGIAAAFWAAIGVGIGALVRNQVGMVVGLCVWLLLIENIVSDSLPSAGRFLPGTSAGALAGASQALAEPKLLAPALGALLLACYVLVATGIGVIATLRRDVS